MSECTHDCATCQSNCADRTEPADLHEAPHPLSNIKKIIAVVSGKGGVGKSMVTSLLAVSMQRAGYRVGILDADITGPSIPKAFGIHERVKGDETAIFPAETTMGIQIMSLNLLLENETDPVVWRGPVIAGTVKQFWTDVIWNDLDYLFIDMPPGTGDVPLTVFQTIPVDGVVVVTSPQELVSMIVEKAVHMAEMMKIPVLGLVENMSYFTCPDCGKELHIFGDSDVSETAKRLHIENTARIPINPKLAAACDKGMIELFDGDWLDSLCKKL